MRNNKLAQPTARAHASFLGACALAVLALLTTACGDGGEQPTAGVVPKVINCSLTEGANDVAIKAGSITIRWSTPVDVADATRVTLSPAATVQMSSAGPALTTVSYGELAPEIEYTLTVGEGAVTAKTGGKPGEAFSLSFTTITPPVPPRPNPDISGALVFDIDPALTNSNAGPEAVALYERLKGWFGHKTLSGSMASHTVGTESNDWVVAETGKNTAIACFDFMNVNRWDKWSSWDRPYSELITNATNWAANGGIVSCMWHWRDPSGASDEFYCDPDTANGRPTFTTFNASDIFDPESAGYKQMMDEIDLVSDYMAQLQDAGIPVLWRPLHEAQGNRDAWGGAWFWWGNGSGDRAAACVELWRVMYDRMTRVNGLDNLIWVWTTCLTGMPEWYDEGVAWYPGDDVVDIIGIDIYDSDETAGRGSHIDHFKKTAHTAGLRKMVALTECGYIPSAQMMHSEGDTWLWYMPWNGNYTEQVNGNYWAVSFADDRILTREDL